MVAGALANAGYWTGFTGWLGGRRFNPNGYFEDPELIHLNERLLLPVMSSPLDTLGGGHPATRKAPNRRLWLGVLSRDVAIPAQPELHGAMERFLKTTPFCLKDPQFSYTLAAWQPLLTSTRYVCVFRNPMLTAASMVHMCQTIEHYKPMGFSIQNALAVWESMYRHILDRHSHNGCWHFIHYDQLFQEQAVQELEDHIEGDIDRTFADPKLRKSPPEQGLPVEIAEIYSDLCNRAHYVPCSVNSDRWRSNNSVSRSPIHARRQEPLMRQTETEAIPTDEKHNVHRG
jgi:hypothetical protein